jgi:hypothetical protein
MGWGGQLVAVGEEMWSCGEKERSWEKIEATEVRMEVVESI